MLSEKPIIVLDEPTSGLDWDNMCAVANAVKILSSLYTKNLCHAPPLPFRTEKDASHIFMSHAFLQKEKDASHIFMTHAYLAFHY